MEKKPAPTPKTFASRKKWPELHRAMTDALVHTFLARGESHEKAETIALSALDTLIFLLGGQMVYFPFGTLAIADERDRRIVQEFRGDNHAELARKYGISMQHVYRVIKKQREQNRKTECASEGGL